MTGRLRKRLREIKADSDVDGRKPVLRLGSPTDPSIINPFVPPVFT